MKSSPESEHSPSSNTTSLPTAEHLEISIEDLFIEDFQAPLTLAALEVEREEEMEEEGEDEDEAITTADALNEDVLFEDLNVFDDSNVVLDSLALVYDVSDDDEIEPLPSTRRDRKRPGKALLTSLGKVPASVYGLIAAGAVLGGAAWLLVRAASARNSTALNGVFARFGFAS